MTWSRFDDGYDEHDKVEEAWDAERATIGLHVQATTACNRWLSDGLIKPRWLTGKLPDRKERDRVLAALVEHQLFDLLPAGQQRELVDGDGNVIVVGPFSDVRYVVHDFLDRHDSSVQTKARRRADAERKRSGRRPPSGRSPNGVQPDAAGTRRGRHADSGGSPLTGGRASGRPHPDPTLPDQENPPTPKGEWTGPPVKPTKNRQTDLAAYEQQIGEYADWLAPEIPATGRAELVKSAISFARRDGEPTNEHVRVIALQLNGGGASPLEAAA